MGTSIDPIEYDVGELRALARVRGDRYVVDGFLWAELPDSFPPAEWSAAPDRPSTWGGSLDEREKPYLRRLPDGETGKRIAREWVHELVERAGSDAVVEAFAYYESLGWLTEGVREDLEGYLLTVGYRPGGSLEDLSRTDHVQSLARTARLAQLAEADGETPSEGEPRSGSGRHAEVEPRTRGDGRSESDAHPASDGERGWVWGGATAGDEETLDDCDERRDDADGDGTTDSGFEFGATRE